MSILGIEEIFLAVKNMEKSIEFYNGILGIPIDKQDSERTYLQSERGHIVLQIINHTGKHNGGGPLHFAFTVTEDSFDEISESLKVKCILLEDHMVRKGTEWATSGPHKSSSFDSSTSEFHESSVKGSYSLNCLNIKPQSIS